jgi:hypothetical protein
MALLIGKRLDKKGGGEKPTDEPYPMEDTEDGDGDAEKDAVEDSAIADFMAAKDPQTAKAALKDFLAACYPQLADDEPEEEPAPEPEA